MRKTAPIETAILEKIRAAKLRLRFDKVVQRLTQDLKASLADVVPARQSVLITLSAPIKLPAKTSEALSALVREGMYNDKPSRTIHGNQVRFRSVPRVTAEAPRVILFVHNPDSDAALILKIAETCLLQ